MFNKQLEQKANEEIKAVKSEWIENQMNEYAKGSMESKEIITEKLNLRFDEKLNEFLNKIENGCDTLIENYKSFSKTDSKKFPLTFLNELGKIKKFQIPSEGEKSQPLKEIWKIRQEALNAFKEIADRLFEDRLYRKSADIFFILSVIDPLNYDYFLRNAEAEYNLQNYKEALNACISAIQVNPADPFCYLYASKSCMSMYEYGKADKLLDIALLILKDNPQLKEFENEFVEQKEKIKNLLG